MRPFGADALLALHHARHVLRDTPEWAGDGVDSRRAALATHGFGPIPSGLSRPLADGSKMLFVQRCQTAGVGRKHGPFDPPPRVGNRATTPGSWQRHPNRLVARPAAGRGLGQAFVNGDRIVRVTTLSSPSTPGRKHDGDRCADDGDFTVSETPGHVTRRRRA